LDLDDSSHKESVSVVGDAETKLHEQVAPKLSSSVVSLSFIGDYTDPPPTFAFNHQFELSMLAFNHHF
jgi:hypothetical protein